MPNSWEQRKFEDIFNYERPDAYIVADDKYDDSFPTPVLTANKGFILGYTNETRTCNKTCIIFDDFTLDSKYVDFNFMVKSSAMKILTAKNGINLPFAYERLKSTKIENLGHARHYISVVQPTKTSMPTINEQERIGLLFREIDNLITLHQRKGNKLRMIKEALLEKMFPADDEITPKIRFKGFTEAWEQRKLGDVGSVAMNRRIFKEQTTPTGDVPFYKIGTFGGEADAFISEQLFEEYKSKYPYPKKGDILVSASGSIGRFVEYKGEKAYFQDSNIIWLEHSDCIDKAFLKVFYAVVKWAGLEGSTIKRLYNKNVLETAITFPSVKEQQQVGALFENLDNLITLHQCEHFIFQEVNYAKKQQKRTVFYLFQ